MKSLKWWAAGIFGLCLIGLLALWWHAYSEVACVETPEVVQFGKVTRRSFVETVHFFGKTESEAAVSVTALQAGRVESVLVPDGSRVVAGQELFTLGGPELAPEAAAVQSSLKAARAALENAEKSVTLIRDAVNRHLMKQTELTTAMAKAALGRKEVAMLVSRRALLDAAMHLKSPVAGVFANRSVNPGQDVQVAEVMARIVPENKVRVVASLFPPGDVKLKGAMARIFRDDGAVVSGVVARILPERSPAGAELIWIEGSDISTGLAPGTPVKGELRFHREVAVAVPESAIVRDKAGRPLVFVKGRFGVEGRIVKIGLTRGGEVEILSGVRPGEMIAVQGAYELYYRDFSHSFKVAD
ncbi:MAG: efflux RND transporter periplasmic adaptor subunit [Acidobacteria bacterium]|nr:efflux RND transporter periplasmic adaptor subunit [Acidobacteriota bacterium]